MALDLQPPPLNLNMGLDPLPSTWTWLSPLNTLPTTWTWLLSLNYLPSTWTWLSTINSPHNLSMTLASQPFPLNLNMALTPPAHPLHPIPSTWTWVSFLSPRLEHHSRPLTFSPQLEHHSCPSTPTLNLNTTHPSTLSPELRRLALLNPLPWTWTWVSTVSSQLEHSFRPLLTTWTYRLSTISPQLEHGSRLSTPSPQLELDSCLSTISPQLEHGSRLSTPTPQLELNSCLSTISPQLEYGSWPRPLNLNITLAPQLEHDSRAPQLKYNLHAAYLDYAYLYMFVIKTIHWSVNYSWIYINGYQGMLNFHLDSQLNLSVDDRRFTIKGQLQCFVYLDIFRARNKDSLPGWPPDHKDKFSGCPHIFLVVRISRYKKQFYFSK